MAVDSGEAFVTVRETARRLGVHENTIRNWARAGILPTARVPGSRFHRFDARDVERLRRQRGAAVSSVAPERRTIGPELVDADQLSQWAATRDAQGMFPELVRRLLASTPGITSVSIRAGEGVAAPGWDGRAESTDSTYLPAGSLCFEFGVGARPKTKADEDFEKRRDDPDGVVPRDSTFVFVTPRRWTGADAWASDRRAEGVFADVRVLDADDLEGWLQATPGVHYWISEHLGRRPRDAETLETWWARFQAQTEPPLPAALFLAGREREREQLSEFFGSPPGVIAVQAAWRSDAIAFVCATIETLEREARTRVQPPLLVESADVWDRLVRQPGRMTLVPLFQSPDVAIALERGHHVVFPLGRDQVARGPRIELPRPHRHAATEALEAAGLDYERASELAALARRSMPSLARTLARDPRFARPSWSLPPAVEILAPLVLVGSWTASEDDTDVVTRITERPWPEIERTLLHWANTDDPPFVRPSTQWHLASPEEAFLVLRDALTPGDLERWRRIADEVLLETDPRLDLPPEDRPMAGLMSVARTHSSVLREGLAEGAALLGSIAGELLSDGVSGADHARRVVREVLGGANTDPSGRVWRSLTDVLPLLAEAAPEEFLDAVHDDLDRAEPLLASMFQDNDQTSWLYTSSPHTGLLWALETLSWSPDFLLEATRALARLDAIDPGGRLANRPLESLASVLVAWVRHTTALVDLKARAVEQICRREPGVGWRLVLALWPSHHAVSSPPHGARYRDWRPEDRGVSVAEWIEYVHDLVRLAIDLAGDDAARWGELAEGLGPLPPAERDRLLDRLAAIAENDSWDHDQRLHLWERLHNEIAHHRQFPNAEWSMTDEPLAQMQAIADRLEPTTSVERFGYLFDWHPDLPDVDPYDHDAYDARLREQRTNAVKETLESASVDGLRRLAERSPAPTHLGWVVGDVAPENLTPELLTWLDVDDPKSLEVAASWARRKLLDGGVQWLREMLGRPEMVGQARRTALALNAPPTSEVWDALAELDADLSGEYWRRMSAWHVDPADAERAARELLAHDRAWVAVDLLAANVRRTADSPTSVTPAIVEEVLNAALAADPAERRSQSLGYEVGLLLDYLEAEGSSAEALARYEFVFFQLLDHHRHPRALFGALGRDPSLFVDLVSRVYRGKNEPKRQLGEQESALAHHAWWVLAHWRDLPGRREDGTVDGEHLARWVRDARLALAEADRADIGDEQMGQVLAASPSGADGIWPAEPVRELIETIGSTNIESGVHLGVINARGVTSRAVFDGGQQERELAAQYREWSRQAAVGGWPRTARLLRGIAERYEWAAQREDAEAELRADTE